MKKALLFVVLALVVVFLGYKIYQVSEITPGGYVYYDTYGFTVRKAYGPGIRIDVGKIFRDYYITRGDRTLEIYENQNVEYSFKNTDGKWLKFQNCDQYQEWLQYQKNKK